MIFFNSGFSLLNKQIPDSDRESETLPRLSEKKKPKKKKMTLTMILAMVATGAIAGNAKPTEKGTFF